MGGQENPAKSLCVFSQRHADVQRACTKRLEKEMAQKSLRRKQFTILLAEQPCPLPPCNRDPYVMHLNIAL